MEYPPSRTNEEINFIKGSLLITNVIVKGLQTLLTNIQDKDLECSHSSEFQKLRHLLLNSKIAENTELLHGISKFVDVRETLFHNVTKQSMTNRELETLTQQIIQVFEELEVPLSDIYKISDKSDYNESEVLEAHEQLSLERRSFCQLGPSCYHAIIQRTAEINTALKELNKLSQRNPNGNSTLLIDGLRGSGKREFAKQLAEALNTSYCTNEPMAVMILNAETEQTLLSSYVIFAKYLLCNLTHIQMAVTSTGLLLEERLRLLMHIIGEKLKSYSHWVVVISNVNHFGPLSDYWPKPGSNDWGSGYLIVTLPDIGDVKSSTLNSCGHVTLSRGMQPSQAIQLLSDVSGIPEKECCLEVAEILHFNPLALSCAAIFARNLKINKVYMPWRVFLETFKDKNILSQFQDKEMFPSWGYSQTCSTAMSMLKTQVLSQNEDFSDMCYLLTVFKPLFIEKKMLVGCLKNISDSHMVRFLHDLSPFLSIETSTESDVVSLRHPIPDCNSHLPELDEKQIEILSHTIFSLSHKLTNVEKASVFSDCVFSVCCDASWVATEMQRLSDNQLNTFVNHFVGCTNTVNDAIDILLKLASQCQVIKKPEHSKVFLTIAEYVIKKRGDLDTRQRHAQVLYLLGVNSLDIGSKDAERYLDKSLELYCQDVCTKKVVDVLSALGDVSVVSKDFGKAKAFYKKAQKKSSMLEDKTGIAHSWFKYGNILAIEGSFQLAKEHYERALKLTEDTNFANLAKVLTCVGAMSVCIGDYHLAKEYLERTLVIEHRLYSKYHPYRLSTIKNAANAYEALGDHYSAEMLLRDSIAISQNITCRLDATVAQVFSQLGSLRALQEDWKSAIKYYGTALEIQQNTLPCQLDSAIADSCCNLGYAYANSGQLDMARSFHERALGIRGLLFQTNHPDVGKSYFRLGKVYNKLDDNKTASSLLERAVEIRDKVLGPEHPETLDSLYHLGYSFSRLGRLKNAKALYQTVAEGQAKLTGTDSALAKTSESLGEVNLRLGEIEFAKQQFKRAVDLQKRVTGPDHPEVARPLVKLALLHEHCKDMKEAKTLLEVALAIYRKNISEITRSHVVVTEVHLKRVLSKLPLKSLCVLM